MVLFINVFVTNQKTILQTPKLQGEYNNLDILKYQLASYSNLYPWKRAIIKIKLDQDFSNRQQELDAFVNNCFGKYDLIYERSRNEKQSEWIKDYELLNDDLIWYNCNHDHPFVDDNVDYLHKIISKIKENPTYSSLRFSHWPEALCLDFMSHNITFTDDYAISEGSWNDSIQVITKDIYFDWWCKYPLPDLIWGRPDYFTNNIRNHIQLPTFKIYVSYRELCRHFDGYMYVNRITPTHICKLIPIPENMFDRKIVDFEEIKNILEHHRPAINPELFNRVLKAYNIN